MALSLLGVKKKSPVVQTYVQQGFRALGVSDRESRFNLPDEYAHCNRFLPFSGFVAPILSIEYRGDSDHRRNACSIQPMASRSGMTGF